MRFFLFTLCFFFQIWRSGWIRLGPKSEEGGVEAEWWDECELIHFLFCFQQSNRTLRAGRPAIQLDFVWQKDQHAAGWLDMDGWGGWDGRRCLSSQDSIDSIRVVTCTTQPVTTTFANSMQQLRLQLLLTHGRLGLGSSSVRIIYVFTILLAFSGSSNRLDLANWIQVKWISSR